MLLQTYFFISTRLSIIPAHALVQTPNTQILPKIHIILFIQGETLPSDNSPCRRGRNKTIAALASAIVEAMLALPPPNSIIDFVIFTGAYSKPRRVFLVTFPAYLL